MTSDISYSSEVVVANDHGLHARPAVFLVEKAKTFQAEITMLVAGARADCKSILDILSCGCGAGMPVTITATGPDSKEAVAALVDLIRGL